MGNKSEIAQLLENIRLSYESARRAMSASAPPQSGKCPWGAITAPHEFITKRMENMQEAQSELQTIVGEREANRLVAQILDAVPETGVVRNEPL